jgi:hypothetical protein
LTSPSPGGPAADAAAVPLVRSADLPVNAPAPLAVAANNAALADSELWGWLVLDWPGQGGSLAATNAVWLLPAADAFAPGARQGADLRSSLGETGPVDQAADGQRPGTVTQLPAVLDDTGTLDALFATGEESLAEVLRG